MTFFACLGRFFYSPGRAFSSKTIGKLIENHRQTLTHHRKAIKKKKKKNSKKTSQSQTPSTRNPLSPPPAAIYHTYRQIYRSAIGWRWMIWSCPALAPVPWAAWCLSTSSRPIPSSSVWSRRGGKNPVDSILNPKVLNKKGQKLYKSIYKHLKGKKYIKHLKW